MLYQMQERDESSVNYANPPPQIMFLHSIVDVFFDISFLLIPLLRERHFHCNTATSTLFASYNMTGTRNSDMPQSAVDGGTTSHILDNRDWDTSETSPGTPVLVTS